MKKILFRLKKMIAWVFLFIAMCVIGLSLMLMLQELYSYYQ